MWPTSVNVTKMKRDRAGDTAGPPVGAAKEEIDVSLDSEEEATKKTMRVSVVIEGSANPAPRIEVTHGTPLTEFRRALFGVLDDGQSISFKDRDSDMCEMTATSDLGELFEMAAEEAARVAGRGRRQGTPWAGHLGHWRRHERPAPGPGVAPRDLPHRFGDAGR